jgi:hypothetical protein
MKADSGNWGQNVEIRWFTTEDTENTEGAWRGTGGGDGAGSRAAGDG